MTTMTEPRHGAEYQFRRSLLAVPASVGLGRDLTEIHLNKWGLTHVAYDAALVVSELLTNALNVKPGHLIGLDLRLLPGALMIEVWDPSDVQPRRKDPMPTDTNGRGLLIVEHYALRWGTRWPPSGGKVVWAQIAIT